MIPMLRLLSEKLPYVSYFATNTGILRSMNKPQKISIRFFNDREVRALWDQQNTKWWFSVLDVVAVLTDQDDYAKTRNYWKYLKAKLKKENSQVVSATTQLKLTAADGKKYKSDMLDCNGALHLIW